MDAKVNQPVPIEGFRTGQLIDSTKRQCINNKCFTNSGGCDSKIGILPFECPSCKANLEWTLFYYIHEFMIEKMNVFSNYICKKKMPLYQKNIWLEYKCWCKIHEYSECTLSVLQPPSIYIFLVLYGTIHQDVDIFYRGSKLAKFANWLQ